MSLFQGAGLEGVHCYIVVLILQEEYTRLCKGKSVGPNVSIIRGLYCCFLTHLYQARGRYHNGFINHRGHWGINQINM